MPVTRLHVLLLVCLSVAIAVWGWYVISGHSIGALLEYWLLLGLYGVASVAFVFARTKDDHLRFFDLPVFLTVLVFVEFGLAPLEYFFKPSQLDYKFHGDAGPLLRGLLYVMLGVAAFWAGCAFRLLRRRRRGGEADSSLASFDPASLRVFEVTVCLYIVAFAARLYMLTHHLYSYLASSAVFYGSLPLIAVLDVAAQFGTYALVAACIETYLRPADSRWRLLFVSIFVSECAWGLISGMKENFLRNFLVVAVVSSLVQRRFRKAWVVAAVLGLVAFYPVSNAYRDLVRGRGEQVTSFAAGERVGAQALATAVGTDSGIWSELRDGWFSTVSRMDLLQSMGLILTMGSNARQLLGRARLWMLPFYPFIPRFIWHSKPTLFEGDRFSVALGYGSSVKTVLSSTAVTYPGDLYIRGGLGGIVVGMFLLGVVAQWLTNRFGRRANRRRLFVYASVFLTVANLEGDGFYFWSSVIRSFVVLSLIAWVVYPPRRLSKALAPAMLKKGPAYGN